MLFELHLVGSNRSSGAVIPTRWPVAPSESELRSPAISLGLYPAIGMLEGQWPDAQILRRRPWNNVLHQRPALAQSLQPLRHSGLNNGAVRQQNDHESLAQWSFHRVREANKPERDRRCSKLLRFESTDLDMVKCCHEVGSDLSRLLFGDGVGGILFPGFEDVLQCPTVLGRAWSVYAIS